jgi:cytochrome c553
MKVLRRLWPLSLVFAALAVVWAAEAQVGTAPVGRALAANCFQCHGTEGRALNGMPSIAGKDAPSLYSDMLEYKQSTDFRNIMVPIAHAYTDQELWELALYIASLPEHPAAGGDAPAVEPAKATSDLEHAAGVESGGDE